MRVICVSGTAGSGKTTFAKKLAKEKGFVYIDANEIIKKEKLYDSYNHSLKTYEVDIKKFRKFFTLLIKLAHNKGVVIDSHLSHFLSPKIIDECIIMKTSIPKLRSRLKKRKYSKKKIEENVDSENFDVCYNEAVELGHKIKVIIT